MINKELKAIRGSKEYSTIVFGDAKSELDKLAGDRRVIIITDSVVFRLYKRVFKDYEHIIIGTGEDNKTIDTLCQIYSQLITMAADRSTLIVGFGGGIVTDIAGFAASTYMRGLDFGFISTTLLGQVDASIGGKNGINYEGYKNMIGTFNQPSFVICDSTLLSTLSEREFRSGIAEVLKMGLIRDSDLFNLFLSYTFEEIYKNKDIQTKIITAATAIKTAIVEEDELEQGERRKLNLGHTIGHAIERCTHNYNHGEAVAIGMSMIAEISVRMGHLEESERQKIDEVLTRMGLPIKSEVSKELIFNGLKLDKKKEDNMINLVIINTIGSCEMLKISFDELGRIFNLK